MILCGSRGSPFNCRFPALDPFSACESWNFNTVRSDDARHSRDASRATGHCSTHPGVCVQSAMITARSKLVHGPDVWVLGRTLRSRSVESASIAPLACPLHCSSEKLCARWCSANVQYDHELDVRRRAKLFDAFSQASFGRSQESALSFQSGNLQMIVRSNGLFKGFWRCAACSGCRRVR